MAPPRPDHPLLLPDELRSLRNVGIERRYTPGSRIVSIGAQSREVFYLLDGLVKIVVVSSKGTESVFGLRKPGEFVGEMSTINDQRRSADVIAVEETLAVVVPAERFTAFLEAHPAVALALLRMQSRRLNDMTIRSMLGSRSVKARVALRLIELAEGSSDPTVVTLTQGDLAQYIDASREWTSKALGELRRDGVIRTARGRVHILDDVALFDATLED